MRAWFFYARLDQAARIINLHAGDISTSAITEILYGKESPETRKLLRIGEASTLDINRATGESGATSFIAEYLCRRGNM